MTLGGVGGWSEAEGGRAGGVEGVFGGEVLSATLVEYECHFGELDRARSILGLFRGVEVVGDAVGVALNSSWSA
jgi:hypothetical protein